MTEIRYRVLWADYSKELGVARKIINPWFAIFRVEYGVTLELVERSPEALRRIEEGGIDLLCYHLTNFADQCSINELERIRRTAPELPIVGITNASPSDIVVDFRGRVVRLLPPYEIKEKYELADMLFSPLLHKDGPERILSYIPDFSPPRKK